MIRIIRATLWMVATLAVLGLIGLALLGVAGMLARRGRRISAGRTVVALAAVLLAVGGAGSLATLVAHPEPCRPPPDAATEPLDDGEAADITLAEEILTAPQTGLGLIYTRAVNGEICRFTASDYDVAIFDLWPFPRTGVFVGNVFLSRRLSDKSVEEIFALSEHELVHRHQWAAGTLIGGPLAFPIAYTIDELLFPGPRNHFERAAGLEEGGYTPETGASPRLRGEEVLVLAVVITAVEGAARAVRWQRAHAPRRRADTHNG